MAVSLASTPPASILATSALPTSAQSPQPVELLPTHRIVSYYGFPENALMGILGEHSKRDLLPILQSQADEYAALDPSRPVKLAFETMVSVAMRDPGPDNDHLEYTDPDTIEDYVKFTAQNDMLLFLDVQFGRNTIEREIRKTEVWLVQPHVHLALDPEFSVDDGEVPGETLGAIDASDIQYALDRLAEIAVAQGIPSKLLLVHQFNWASITNPALIEPVQGAQLVHEIDGWGPPAEKHDTYDALTGVLPTDWHGFKLWYRQDDPLMTPSEVLALQPAPDIIIYQ